MFLILHIMSNHLMILNIKKHFAKIYLNKLCMVLCHDTPFCNKHKMHIDKLGNLPLVRLVHD